MNKLTFYDLKRKKKFTTDKYVIKTKKNPRTKRVMKIAYTTAPSGAKSTVFVK